VVAPGGADAGFPGQTQDGDGQVACGLNKTSRFCSSSGASCLVLAWSRTMIGDDGPSRDLAALVVPQAGRPMATGDRYEPYRLVDGEGVAVVAATAYFRDLLAAGRAESTVRSYGMDLLRWFRFLRAAGVAWIRRPASRPAISAAGWAYRGVRLRVHHRRAARSFRQPRLTVRTCRAPSPGCANGSPGREPWFVRPDESWCGR